MSVIYLYISVAYVLLTHVIHSIEYKRNHLSANLYLEFSSANSSFLEFAPATAYHSGY